MIAGQTAAQDERLRKAMLPLVSITGRALIEPGAFMTTGAPTVARVCGERMRVHQIS